VSAFSQFNRSNNAINSGTDNDCPLLLHPTQNMPLNTPKNAK